MQFTLDLRIWWLKWHAFSFNIQTHWQDTNNVKQPIIIILENITKQLCIFQPAAVIKMFVSGSTHDLPLNKIKQFAYD